jgi:nicotinate phosphoribosyltransferase
MDSYSTLKSGVKNFLVVAIALDDLGYKPLGIRLDSGDLAYLSKGCRKLFDETAKVLGRDFSYFKITASNDINEDSIIKLKEDGHEIN